MTDQPLSPAVSSPPMFLTWPEPPESVTAARDLLLQACPTWAPIETKDPPVGGMDWHQEVLLCREALNGRTDDVAMLYAALLIGMVAGVAITWLFLSLWRGAGRLVGRRRPAGG